MLNTDSFLNEEKQGERDCKINFTDTSITAFVRFAGFQPSLLTVAASKKALRVPVAY